MKRLPLDTAALPEGEETEAIAAAAIGERVLVGFNLRSGKDGAGELEWRLRAWSAKDGAPLWTCSPPR